eukprot:597539_1
MDQKQKEYHPLQASLDAKQRECTQKEERLRSVRTETKQQMERFKQRQNGEIKAKETKLQAIEAKCEALSVQHNEMVASQHRQKTEYESKTLESTRLHDGLKDQLNKKKEDLAAINRKYDDVSKENNTRIAALEDDKNVLEKRLNGEITAKQKELHAVEAKYDALSKQYNENEATQKEQNAKYELEMVRLKEELREKSESVLEETKRHQDELDAVRSKNNAQNAALESEKKALSDKEAELQSMAAKFDALSEQHNEMVAAQHEQKTEYESKALEFTRLHEELKVLKVFSEIDADADADKAIPISKLRKDMNSKLKQVQNQCEQLKGHNKKLKSQSKSTEKSLKEKDQMIQTLKQQQNEMRTKYDANHTEEVNKIKAMMEDKLKLQTEKHDASMRDLQEQLDTAQTEQQEKEREYAKSLQKVNDDKMNTKKELKQARKRLQEQDEQLVAKQ